MRYIPNTPPTRQAMLQDIGLSKLDDLFNIIPQDIRYTSSLQIPEGKSEYRLLQELEAKAAQNYSQNHFLGAGAYKRYIPTAIAPLVSRAEFLTSYTPYQPELCQGSLMAMFEFQSLLSSLTGMDVANASMYEGASAMAEAVLMAKRIYPQGKIVLYSQGLHPEYIQTMETYTLFQDIEFIPISLDKTGKTDLAALKQAVTKETLCSITPMINFNGVIEDYHLHADLLEGTKAVSIAVLTDMSSLGIIEAPGKFGFDIFVGEGQSLGLPLSYGGPYLGIFACKQAYIRRMPGRIVGKAKDVDGNDAFCLILATREQHIRREKATSNICSNQTLCAIWVTVYLSLLGKLGLQKLARLNMANATYLKKQCKTIQGISLRYGDSSFYNEFVIECKNKLAQAILNVMLQDNIIGGVALSRFDSNDTNAILVSVTEVNSKEEMDKFVLSLQKAVA